MVLANQGELSSPQIRGQDPEKPPEMMSQLLGLLMFKCSPPPRVTVGGQDLQPQTEDCGRGYLQRLCSWTSEPERVCWTPGCPSP